MTTDGYEPSGDAEENPLVFLRRFEERTLRDQEALLREHGTDWAALLSRYVDALAHEAAPEDEGEPPVPERPGPDPDRGPAQPPPTDRTGPRPPG
ncbi:hypothetical protein IHE55_08990 [Streptomyces pactum]|uniref:Uncharacterized protein n=1 Tax=Streptomyces pactum TaxID=68249 RepID=A0ABS0NI88_9ACTN|nr:DUF6269 family protein [Streptomyces pactum]MBH5334918.1 hypothetical protein [Streptomyces pactum]